MNDLVSVSNTDFNNIEDIKDLSGRLTVIKYFSSAKNTGLSINIGSKESNFADINLDVVRNSKIDICASALSLPFKDSVFSEAYFTEVMEHLPLGTENKALAEIYGALNNGGLLIMSVPNGFGAWKFLDPAFYTEKHRHYKKNSVLRLVEDVGLKIKFVFTSGGLWEVFGNLVYCFAFYPVKRLFGLVLPLPLYIDRKVISEFRKIKPEGGCNLFIIALKQ
jgi:SAM-dependent methyltransferase